MKRLIGILAVLAAVFMVVPAFASNITAATYSGVVTVTNSSTTTIRVAVPFTLSTQQMLDNGYITSDCLNTAMQMNGTDVAYQPAASGSSAWNVFIPTSIPKGTVDVKLYTGGTDMTSKIRMFPGALGYSNVGAFTLSSNTWTIEIKGWFDLSQTGNFVNLVNGADHITVARASSSSISAELHAGANSNTVTAAALTTTAEHTLKVESTPGAWVIYWDGVSKDTIARTADFGAINIPSAASQYVTGNVMPYVEYIKFTVGVALTQHIVWENSATVFNDQTVNNNDMTPTFRSTSSDADVSAAITSYNPISVADAPDVTSATFIDDVPDAIPNMYDEGETGGLIFEDLIDPALTVATIPKEVFWFPIAFAIAIGLGFAAFGKTKSLIVQSAVSAIVMAFFCGGGLLGDGLLPYWTVVFFVIEAVMVIIIQEHQRV